MSNVINRVNDEFGFNYQKFVKNNIVNPTSIDPSDKIVSKFNNIDETKPVKTETMDFDEEKPKKEDAENLEMEE